MTDPQHPNRADQPPLPILSAAPDEEQGWSRRAIFGTALLIALMVVVGLFAAITVTPGPDEEALARPADVGVVLAGDTPLSWDPAAISDGASAQVLAQVYEGLTVLDTAAQVQPALAETWRVESDGRRIVFELRDGLTFSDGEALTAADVRRSWLRVIDPDRPSPLSSLLDDVAGAAAYARGEGSAEDVGIAADGLTLTVDFERPAAYFPAVAAVPSLAVVPTGIDSQARGPVDGVRFSASGPYLPVDQELGQLRLEGNTDYWAGAPPIADIAVVTDDGGRSSVDIFEDEAVDLTRISPADASWIRYDRRLGPQLRHTDEMVVDFLGFDTSTAPFDDAGARRAVAMAVDWRRLAALGGTGDPVPTSILPPGIPSRGEGDYLLPYDPEAARAALAAAGYPDGEGFPAIALATYGVGPSAAIAVDLERELGIEVNVELRPFDEHSAILDQETPAMWTLAWSADYPHAHDFLGLLLRSGSSANLGGWSDSRFDALIDAAAATSDPVEQQRLYGEAQEVVREDAPVIPLDYGSSWWLSRDGLAGGHISGVGILRFADLAWDDR
jgi:ABC-type oligopeptide transport system substrate-binding subunit